MTDRTQKGSVGADRMTRFTSYLIDVVDSASDHWIAALHRVVGKHGESGERRQAREGHVSGHDSDHRPVQASQILMVCART